MFDVAPICKEYNIPLISDGGNKNSGNMCKALASGASCLMLGRLVAGAEEVIYFYFKINFILFLFYLKINFILFLFYLKII